MKKSLVLLAVFLAGTILVPAAVFAGAPPAAPVGLTATVTASDTVVLQWRDNSLDETSFRIERANDEAFTRALRQMDAPMNGTGTAGFTDTNAVERNVYWYRVFAVNAEGDSTSSNAVKVVTPGTLPRMSLVRPAPSGANFASGAGNLIAAAVEFASSGIEYVQYQLVLDDPAGTFNAHDIFSPQLPLGIPGTLAPSPTSDDTEVPAGLPLGSISEMEVYGTVTGVDPVKGEWRIGAQPVLVYESAATTFAGSRRPAVGDSVKVLARRTPASGPLVAHVISFRAPGPNPAGPAVKKVAFLFNGTVESIRPDANPAGLFFGGATWTVGGASFHVNDRTYPDFPAYIDQGLGVGSTVTVRFAAPQVTPPIAREIFLQQPLVFLPPMDTSPEFNNDPVPMSLPAGAWVQYLIRGVITAVDPVTGEWQIGNPPVKFYEHAGTLIAGRGGDRLSQIGSEFIVVAMRTEEAGPLVADQIRINLNGPMIAEPARVQTLYLFNGTVEATGNEMWTVSGVDFVVNDFREPAVIDPGTRSGISVGTQVTVEFRPASELLPDQALWAPLVPSATTGLWEAQVDLPASEMDRTGVLFLRVMDIQGDCSTIAVNAVMHGAALPSAAPTGLTASVVGPSRVELAWRDNSDNESGFRAERAPDLNGVPGAWSVLGTTSSGVVAYSDRAIAAGNTYHYRVSAFNALGSSVSSNVARVTVPGTVPLPPAPLFPANGSSINSLVPRLSWNASAGAVTYDLQVTLSADTLFAHPLVQVNEVGVTFYDVLAGALSSGVSYRWRVRGNNVAGSSGWSRVFTFRTTYPPQPRLLAVVVTNVTPRLNWTQVAGAISYDVQISRNTVFAPLMAEDTGLADAFFDVPAGVLQGASTYFWRVRVTTGAGTSRWSSIGSFRTPSGPRYQPLLVAFPRGIAPSLNPTLQWRVVRDEATSFDVQVSTSQRFGAGTIVFEQLAVAAPAFSPTVPVNLSVPSGTLAPATGYYWRVRSVNELGASLWRMSSFKTP